MCTLPAATYGGYSLKDGKDDSVFDSALCVQASISLAGELLDKHLGRCLARLRVATSSLRNPAFPD